MASAFSIISSIAKSQKPLIAVFLLILSTLSGWAISYIITQNNEIGKNIIHIQELRRTANENIKSIAILNESVSHQVSRPSFNQYIQKRDNEHQKQIQINSVLESSLGNISGQLSEIVRSLHILEATLLRDRK